MANDEIAVGLAYLLRKPIYCDFARASRFLAQMTILNALTWYLSISIVMPCEKSFGC